MLLFVTLGTFPSAYADQTQDIHSLIQDMDYMIERVEVLQKKYNQDKGKVVFNYPLLLSQLLTTRNRVTVYLNKNIQEIHAAPPATIDKSLIK